MKKRKSSYPEKIITVNGRRYQVRSVRPQVAVEKDEVGKRGWTNYKPFDRNFYCKNTTPISGGLPSLGKRRP